MGGWDAPPMGDGRPEPGAVAAEPFCEPTAVDGVCGVDRRSQLAARPASQPAVPPTTPPTAPAPAVPRRVAWRAFPQAPATPEVFAAPIWSLAKCANRNTARGENAASNTQMDPRKASVMSPFT